MVLLKVGDKIPDFSCFDDKENLITNKDLIGKKTIIFFYPRANTPGCTAQACNLSENFSELGANKKPLTPESILSFHEANYHGVNQEIDDSNLVLGLKTVSLTQIQASSDQISMAYHDLIYDMNCLNKMEIKKSNGF